jgi:propanediol dehydratase small subunit
MKTFAILIALAVAASAQLVPQTQLQADLSTIAKAADGTTYYGERFAHALNRTAAIWSLPDDRLVDVLNALGQERVAALVALQAAQAAALNAGLEAAGSSVRVNVAPTREFSWSNGQVILVPQPPAEE